MSTGLGALSTAHVLALIAAQTAGGVTGAVMANLMFDLGAVSMSPPPSSRGLWLGEVVATLGLVVVVFGVVRSGRAQTVAFAVGGCITAAYWFPTRRASSTRP